MTKIGIVPWKRSARARSMIGPVSLVAAIAVSGCATSAEPENYATRVPIAQAMADYDETLARLRVVISEQADVGPWEKVSTGSRSGCAGEESLEFTSGVTPRWAANTLPKEAWPRVRDAVIKAAAESGFTTIDYVSDEPTFSLVLYDDEGAEFGLRVPPNVTNMSIILGCHPRGMK
jgi:hypothetical protein